MTDQLDIEGLEDFLAGAYLGFLSNDTPPYDKLRPFLTELMENVPDHIQLRLTFLIAKYLVAMKKINSPFDS